MPEAKSPKSESSAAKGVAAKATAAKGVASKSVVAKKAAPKAAAPKTAVAKTAVAKKTAAKSTVPKVPAAKAAPKTTPKSAPKATAPPRVEPTEEDFALARAALLEITEAVTIGEPAGSLTEADGSLTMYFDTTMAGYPGWKWTVGLAHVKGFAPTVMETELTPGEGALLSPDWVPWSERLADYKEAQALIAAEALALDDDDDGDDDDDFDDSDDDDFDDEDVNDDDEALLHSGDLDGVDIDSLDEADVVDDGAGSAPPAVRNNQPKKAKDEADDASPNPASKSRRSQGPQ